MHAPSCTHARTHKHTQRNMQMQTDIYTHACIHMHVHRHPHAHKFTGPQTCKLSCAHTHTHTHRHTSHIPISNAHMQIHIHMHRHTRPHTTQRWGCRDNANVIAVVNLLIASLEDTPQASLEAARSGLRIPSRERRSAPSICLAAVWQPTKFLMVFHYVKTNWACKRLKCTF